MRDEADLDQALQLIDRIKASILDLDGAALAELLPLLFAAEVAATSPRRSTSAERTAGGQHSPARTPALIAADGAILGSARTLLLTAARIYLSLADPVRLEATRQEMGETDRLLDLALVEVLNVMDFQWPSWKPVRPEHLNLGFEVVAARRYVLRGEVRSGRDLPNDIRGFPQLP